jgi:hypothetical protein
LHNIVSDRCWRRIIIDGRWRRPDALYHDVT